MEVFLGQIIMMAINYTPEGFLPCNGQLLPIQQNAALFSLLGTTYGGDGKTNFALPNLMNQMPMMVNKNINGVTTDHDSSISLPVTKVQYFIAIQGLFPSRS